MVIPKKFFHCYEVSEPHVRLPNLRIQQRDRKSPRNLTLKAYGFDYRTSHRMGGNRDSTLGGHKQNLVCAKIQREGVVTSQQIEPDLPASVGGSPVEVCVGSGLP